MPNDSSKKITLEKPIYEHDFLWKDPYPSDPGSVLLSDKIAHYAEKFGLIVPFVRDNLRPAQYTLRVGDKGYCTGKKIKISKDKPLIIPPNGLVYIKIYEYLNIPYYMIARYSLRVKQVYRGLILDNGLQVDPGFHGHINVPVYNFTNEDKKLEFCERILSVEFVKTTAFKPNPPINVNKEREWVCSDLINENNYPLKLFQEKPEELYFQKDIPGYFEPNEKNESSVLELKNKVVKFSKRVNQIKRWGMAGAAIIIISLCGYIYETHDSFAQARIDADNARLAVKLQQAEEEKKYEKINKEIIDLKDKRIESEKAMSNQIKELQNKIVKLENSISELQNRKEKQGS